MFTHIFQIWLTIFVSGITIAAIITWFLDRQEARGIAREYAANTYANMVVASRAMRGEYVQVHPEMVMLDHEIMHQAYLEHNS